MRVGRCAIEEIPRRSFYCYWGKAEKRQTYVTVLVKNSELSVALNILIQVTGCARECCRSLYYYYLCRHIRFPSSLDRQVVRITIIIIIIRSNIICKLKKDGLAETKPFISWQRSIKVWALMGFSPPFLPAEAHWQACCTCHFCEKADLPGRSRRDRSGG